jgi:hypothetical protein
MQPSREGGQKSAAKQGNPGGATAYQPILVKKFYNFLAKSPKMGFVAR